jgi:hypothetical protein
MFAICGGMPRAGSTLHYQIVAHLVETYSSGRRLGFVQTGLLPEFRREVIDNRWRAIKTHLLDPGLTGLLEEGRAVGFYIYRDIRDVVCSMMRRGPDWTGPPLSCPPRLIDNDRAWRATPPVLVHRYEDVVADLPKAVREIATHLGITLATREADEIAALYSLEANRARTRSITSRPAPSTPHGSMMPGHPASSPGNPLNPASVTAASDPRCVATDIDGVDLRSLLRWDHIGTGQVGGWRTTLSASDVETLRPSCTEWLIANSYEADEHWGVTRPVTTAGVA